MKKFIVCLLILSGCSPRETDFIPGIYVKQFTQEYNIGSDTLVITAADEPGSNYAIERHLKYTPVKDGKKLSAHAETANWFGNYNRDSKQLMVQPSGKVLTFSPERQCVYMGYSVYQKVK